MSRYLTLIAVLVFAVSEAAAQQQQPERRDYRIRLVTGQFDPLTDQRYLASATAEETTHAIVQFRAPLTREQRASVQKELGLKLTDYVPNFAYLERVNAQTRTRLGQSPLVRAVVPYVAEMKIDPTIGRRQFRTPMRQSGGLRLTLTLFDDADVAAALEAVRKVANVRILAAQDDSKEGGPKRIQIVATSAAVITALAAIAEVQWIEEQPELEPRNGATAGVIQSGTNGNETVWDRGLHGEQQIIGIIDNLLDMNHCFVRDSVDNTVRPAHRKIVGLRDNTGENPVQTDHGSHVVGIAIGDDFGNSGNHANRGNAWAARSSFGNMCDFFGCNMTPASPPSFYSYLIAARNDGAIIHTNSWGDNVTTYGQLPRDIDTFTWENENSLVLVAAANGNPAVAVTTPENAKNCLAVNAAARSPNQMNHDNGSFGPTNDNRRKPEIYAPGDDVNSMSHDTACNLVQKSGTSMATPAVAAAAALARQYYAEGWYPTGTRQPHHAILPSGALLKATLLNATIDMTSMAGYPGNTEGFGLLNLDNALFFAGDARSTRVWDVRHANGVATGEDRTFTFRVENNTQQLRVTLAWTEPPAALNAADQLINDLDLRVTGPDGTLRRGNDFANTGAVDVDNNVEMVLVGAPAVGEWTITVRAISVAVGAPGQGFAVVATGDLPVASPPTGPQDTLFVRARFSDIATAIPEPDILNIAADAGDYLETVSYNQVSLNASSPEVVLDNGTAHYYDSTRTPLVELAQDVITKLIANGVSLDPVDRLVIVTNDPAFNRDWATTGAWPYDFAGGVRRPLSVSIQSQTNTLAQFTHGLSHHFGMVDLYAHENVTFPRPFADDWDNMATPFENQHPLTWEKLRAQWLAAGSNIEFVPRPPAGTTASPAPFTLAVQEPAGNDRKMIVIGLTPGATFDTEKTFYVVEARDRTADAYEPAIPESGVLLYLVNTQVPQGEGPVLLLDADPSTPVIDPFQAADAAHTIPGTGITMDVESGTEGGPYQVRITYASPSDNYNARITRGDTRDGVFMSWFSPDIWLDSPVDGENFATAPPGEDEIERPVADSPNFIRVRIFNDGPAIAENFQVRVRISEPYHTVGNEADFDKTVCIFDVRGLVPAGASVPPDMVPSGQIFSCSWTPLNTGNEHSCVYVDIINLTGNDTNANDNAAQENLEIVSAVTGSPYHPVDFNFQMENPYTNPALFYFRVDGAPAGWTVVTDPPKALLQPGQQIEAKVTVTPPPDEPICTSRVLEVTSWTPRGDTLIPVGGSVLQVDMRRPTKLTLAGGERPCGEITGASAKFSCRQINGSGCTDPPLPNQKIWVQYRSATGQTVWHEVTTDANGCFEDFLLTGDSDVWSVTAGFEGSDCQAPVREGPKVSGIPPGLGGLFRDLWFSLHLGHNFPLGDFRKEYASGPSITIDLERQFRERFAFYAMLGYHYFDAKLAGGDETYVVNLSFNLRVYGSAGPWRPFAGFGPGLYRLEGGGTKAGGNLSLGLELPILSKLSLETGADLHLFDPGDRKVFTDVKLGVKWQF